MADEVKVDPADAIIKGLEQLADDDISMSILDWTVFSHACLGAAAAMRETRRLTIKYHGLGMKDPAQWRVGLEEIASVVAEEGAEPDTRDAAALQAENEKLREALKPMADAWHKLQSDGAPHLNADPEKPSHGMGTIKQKHTKRAADLLGTKGPKP